MFNFFNKKYKLINQSIEYSGTRLYRIVALKDFGKIKKGTIGGFVESEENLSQDGDCWIHDDAKVLNGAVVKDGAQVNNHSVIKDDAVIMGKSETIGHAMISDSVVGDNAVISENVCVFSNSYIGGDIILAGNMDLYRVQISGDAILTLNPIKIETYYLWPILVFDNCIYFRNNEIPIKKWKKQLHPMLAYYENDKKAVSLLMNMIEQAIKLKKQERADEKKRLRRENK